MSSNICNRSRAMSTYKIHNAALKIHNVARKIHTVALKIHTVALKIHILALKIHTLALKIRTVSRLKFRSTYTSDRGQLDLCAGSQDGPIGRRTRGYILTTDQSGKRGF
eukprot:2150847-Pyramimonas_sp.AAC.1